MLGNKPNFIVDSFVKGQSWLAIWCLKTSITYLLRQAKPGAKDVFQLTILASIYRLLWQSFSVVALC